MEIDSSVSVNEGAVISMRHSSVSTVSRSRKRTSVWCIEDHFITLGNQELAPNISWWAIEFINNNNIQNDKTGQGMNEWMKIIKQISMMYWKFIL